MAIQARDAQVQGLCTLADHLGIGRSLGQVHQNEHCSTQVSVRKEKEETRNRKGTQEVPSECLLQ